MITRVEELINPITGEWDEDLLYAVFWPVDIHRILQIPLSHGREDMVAWQHTKDGVFTVRSAYHAQWGHKLARRFQGFRPNCSAESKVWGLLWNLELPEKIKIFGWRLLHATVPCRGILANKHVGNESGCQICSAGCEDIKHMVFTCPRAREVWQKLGVWSKIEEVLHIDRSGSIILEEVIRRGGRVKELNEVGMVELILTGAWYIWWERRQAVHGEKVQTTTRSALTVATITRNYMMAKSKTAIDKSEERWRKPEEGTLKINVDAAFDVDSGSRGVGGNH